jgi:RNA polymerase sigma-70 factor (ECF subfamily)
MAGMLSEVFVAEYNNLLRVAFRLANNKDDALDLLQDLAEIIVLNDRQIRDTDNPMAYFKKILRNRSIDAAKKGNRETSTDPITIEMNVSNETVETQVAYKNFLNWLKKELEIYPVETQEAFFMYYFDGFSLDEVANRLAVNNNTLSQRFSRIRKKLETNARKESLYYSFLIIVLLRTR